MSDSSADDTLFISDLHLDASRPAVTQAFIEFLRGPARAARALYMLGDLFEAWIGDDDPDADKARVMDALRELTHHGVACYLIHGNRDFLIGKRFAQRTGVQLLEDGTTVDLDGERVLLLHGDTLCTDDHSYQRLRRLLRNPFSRLLFRVMTLSQRQRLAKRLRAGSQAHLDSLSTKAPAIMDVNADAVRAAFRSHRVHCMIHGHTHRPAIHSLDIDGKPATRIVLGDWYTQGSVLRWDRDGYELLRLSIGVPE